MNLSKHLKQTVTIERREYDEQGNPRYDGFGQPLYAAPANMRALYLQKEGVRRSATGDDVEVESYALTDAPVSLGDKIEGSDVRRVEPIVRKGKVIGRECYL